MMSEASWADQVFGNGSSGGGPIRSGKRVWRPMTPRGVSYWLSSTAPLGRVARSISVVEG